MRSKNENGKGLTIESTGTKQAGRKQGLIKHTEVQDKTQDHAATHKQGQAQDGRACVHPSRCTDLYRHLESLWHHRRSRHHCRQAPEIERGVAAK